MVRPASLAALGLLLCSLTRPANAEPSPDTEPMVARALAVQKAMLAGRDLLTQSRGKEAVEALEAEILYINGNPHYLALLREAYGVYLKELLIGQGDAAKIEYVRKQLRILDPKGEAEKPATTLTPVTVSPPEPMPAETAQSNAPPPLPAPDDLPARPEPPPKPAQEDPFQQEPADRAGSADLRARALAAFQQKNYAEADRLFGHARQAGNGLGREENEAWGYCKLHQLAIRLNQPGDGGWSPEQMEQEARVAVELGGERLNAFAGQVLAAVRKRQQSAPAAPATTATLPDGWQSLTTDNFRIIYRQNRELATEAGRVAESARTAMFERWSGAAPAAWQPRCDLWMHAAAGDYAAATRQPAHSPGHATVAIKGNRVMSRRLDLRCDDAELLDVTVPREVTYVVLSDLFPDQQLPRWAEVAMTVLAEPPTQVARYLRAVPRCREEKKLVPVGQLLAMQDFPKAGAGTEFYAESVSVVDYLVRMKGAKAFAIFLREAPRRGVEKALQTHYGFKDSNDLQEKWLKHACAQ